MCLLGLSSALVLNHRPPVKMESFADGSHEGAEEKKRRRKRADGRRGKRKDEMI